MLFTVSIFARWRRSASWHWKLDRAVKALLTQLLRITMVKSDVWSEGRNET